MSRLSTLRIVVKTVDFGGRAAAIPDIEGDAKYLVSVTWERRVAKVIILERGSWYETRKINGHTYELVYFIKI